MKALIQMFTVIGITILVAMIVAVVVQAIVMVLGRSAERAAVVTPGAKPLPQQDDGRQLDDGRPPAAHVAAIAAAVALTLEGGRVIHIESIRSEAGWATAGRQSHHTSHNVGHRPSRRGH